MKSDARGDREFVQFYERTVDVVYGYFIRRTAGDRQMAEDLTQETFLTAARTYDGQQRNENAWIVTVARRRLIDHIRRTKSRPRLFPLSDPVDLVHWPDDWGQQEHDVFSALRTLQPDHQMVLLLHYVDDLALGEVANFMSRSRTATYSLLARAKSSLRQALEEAPRE